VVVSRVGPSDNRVIIEPPKVKIAATYATTKFFLQIQRQWLVRHRRTHFWVVDVQNGEASKLPKATTGTIVIPMVSGWQAHRLCFKSHRQRI
jgi:hypothetical protein